MSYNQRNPCETNLGWVPQEGGIRCLEHCDLIHYPRNLRRQANQTRYRCKDEHGTHSHPQGRSRSQKFDHIFSEELDIYIFCHPTHVCCGKGAVTFGVDERISTLGSPALRSTTAANRDPREPIVLLSVPHTVMLSFNQTCMLMTAAKLNRVTVSTARNKPIWVERTRETDVSTKILYNNVRACKSR